MRFRAAHVPSGNVIIETSHRTIKTMAARSKCLIPEAVYIYNVTPKDDVDPKTAPINGWGGYLARTKGIEDVGKSRSQHVGIELATVCGLDQKKQYATTRTWPER